MDRGDPTNWNLLVDQWPQDQTAGDAQYFQDMWQPSIYTFDAFDNQASEQCQWPFQDTLDGVFDYTLENIPGKQGVDSFRGIQKGLTWISETMLFNTDPILSLPTWNTTPMHTMDAMCDPCFPTDSIGFCLPQQLLGSSNTEHDLTSLCGNFETSTLHSGSLLCQPFTPPSESDPGNMQPDELVPDERSHLNASPASLAAPAGSRSTSRTCHSRRQRCKLDSTAGGPCNQRSSQTNELTQHQQVVHGEIPRGFHCAICVGKSFTRKDSLMRHYRKAHPQQQQQQQQ